jgi:hypothetical protein
MDAKLYDLARLLNTVVMAKVHPGSKRALLLFALVASTASFLACTSGTSEEEDTSEGAASSPEDDDQGAYPFERHVTCIHHRRERTRAQGAELTRAWHLKIHGCLKGKLTVDPALPNDKRIGVFSNRSAQDVWMRLTNINQPADDVVDLRGLAIKVLKVPGAKKMPGDPFDGQDFLMNDTKVHFVNTPEEVIRASEINDGSPKDFFFSDIPLLFAMLTRGRKQLTLPNTLLNHEYHSRAPYRFGGANIIRYYVKTCSETPDAAKIAADTPPKDRLTVDFQNRARENGVCLDFMAKFRSVADSDKWLDDLITPWDDTPVKLATIQFPPQDPQANAATCESLTYDPLHTIAAHEGVGIMNKGREFIYRASREAASKRRSIERFACTNIFPDFDTKRDPPPSTDEHSTSAE